MIIYKNKYLDFCMLYWYMAIQSDASFIATTKYKNLPRCTSRQGRRTKTSPSKKEKLSLARAKGSGEKHRL